MPPRSTTTPAPGRAVPPGLRPVTPPASVLLPPSEPSPLHEAILCWLDRQS